LTAGLRPAFGSDAAYGRSSSPANLTPRYARLLGFKSLPLTCLATKKQLGRGFPRPIKNLVAGEGFIAGLRPTLGARLAAPPRAAPEPPRRAAARRARRFKSSLWRS